MTTDESTMLPCSNCGAELSGEDWLPKDEWAEEPVGFEFGGEAATRAYPTIKCPECGEKVII